MSKNSLNEAKSVEKEENEHIELWPAVAPYFIYDDMIYDALTTNEPRNNSYKIAINNLVKDKVVVDIGTGADAILARFCVEANAKKVYAIEIMQSSYKKAKTVIEKLGLENKIILIYGDATKVELPEKVDVCVSEIVGSIGGLEGSATILNNAWRFLKKDGIMIPRRSLTKISVVSLPKSFINNIKFSELGEEYTHRIFEHVGSKFDLKVNIEGINESCLVSNEDVFEDLDHISLVKVEHKHEINLIIKKDSTIHGFLAWLNLFTKEDEIIDIMKDGYCWSPAFIPVFYPGIDVTYGDRVRATIHRTLCKNGINPDYEINGCIERQNGENIKFEYKLPHFVDLYKGTPFYQKLFEKY